jgi:hypothetical protein
MCPPAAFSLTETPLTRGVRLIEAGAGTGKTYASVAQPHLISNAARIRSPAPFPMAVTPTPPAHA